MAEKILVIEDDPLIVEMIKSQIERLGFELSHVADGQLGLDTALAEDISLALIDANLPSLDGFDICRRLRDKKQKLPIIMLTSRADEVDKILGLEFGADDYITKPFSVRELATRIKALLRRCSITAEQVEESGPLPEGVLQFGPLIIDSERRSVSLEGKPVDMSATEFDLLYFLARNPGKVLSRDELMEGVWGYNAKNFEPTVTVTLSRLRCKIEPHPSKPQFIHTIRGVGYRFVEYKNGQPVKY